MPWCLTVALLLSAFAMVRAENAAADNGWLTNYKDALAAANTNKKIVLADFTGSDWCHFCIQLKKEVLDTPEFKKLADQKLVLLEVDFPQQKAQADDVKKQNQELQKKYKVSGYPTIILLDGTGKKLGQIVGYSGKAAWMKQLNAILAKAG